MRTEECLMRLIDSHAHLDEESFDADREEMILRAQTAGVERMVSIGTTTETSRRAIDLAAKHECIFASVGIHPNYVHEAKGDDWETIVALSRSPKVVAIGETGLDRYWKFAPYELQVDYFRRHMRLSRETGLPFVVHCRDAEVETLAELELEYKDGPLNGVMHCFVGSIETARRCLDMGMYISFAGMVTFKANQKLRDVALEIPADRILVETDSPYLAPREFRGKRNEPAWVTHTAWCLAETRGVTTEEFGEQVTANAQRLFRLPR